MNKVTLFGRLGKDFELPNLAVKSLALAMGI
ncbi:single-stranded DNA-binding protein [Campylobacter sp. MIT 97-5078]|nr:single-stranded DNA-binding protein [Campylobacter sp. MIT 97-5078]